MEYSKKRLNSMKTYNNSVNSGIEKDQQFRPSWFAKLKGHSYFIILLWL